jgi:acyl-CoA reductase-like NAD-dependent aldehyde dehydrogenase
MTSTFTVISPVDGTPLLSRNYATPEEIDRVMERSLAAFHDWKRVPLEERIRLALKFVDCFVAKKDDIAREITMQMGRPIRFAAKEVKGFEDRARYVAAIAPQALADVVPQEAVGAPAPAKRYIRREPLGPVLVLAAWNYPYLVSVNAVVPALLAGKRKTWIVRTK